MLDMIVESTVLNMWNNSFLPLNPFLIMYVLAGGDYSNDSSCQEYWTYWQTAGYPGLPVSGIAQSRSYTPYLLDTVQLYFKICDFLIANNQSITALNVWNALKQPIPMFRGCTGWVAIDPLTGSRDVNVQPPVYDLVTFAQVDWEVRCRSSSIAISLLYLFLFRSNVLNEP